MNKRKYGWRPELPDHRDKTPAEVLKTATPPVVLPLLVDMRPIMPPVYDQGQLGSCVGNATAGAVAYDMIKQGRAVFTAPPSRLFLYYGARALEGTVDQDAGCFIRDAFKVLNKFGVCSEKDWAYDPKILTWPPTASCFNDAAGEQSVSYGRIKNENRDLMRLVLASGFPIVAGFTVYESFASEVVAKTGIVPMPSPSEKVLGGHAVMIVGYDDAAGHYIVRNSWGADWGQGGYCLMPYGYLENPGLADDFWCVTKVK